VWLVLCDFVHTTPSRTCRLRTSSDWETQQLGTLAHEIAGRLRPVCQHLPEAEFDALVERIALLQRKYEQQRKRELSRETNWQIRDNTG
jgi:hypothetical protein